jgi:hypothetical protein
MKFLISNPFGDENVKVKALIRQYYEMLILFYSLNYHPAEYYSFRFHHKDCTYKDMLRFIPYSWFLNKVTRNMTPSSWAVLFANKALFNNFARQKGLNVVSDYGIYNNIYGYDLKDHHKLATADDLEHLFRKYDLNRAVIKDLSGMQGKNIFFITGVEPGEEFRFKIKEDWITKNELASLLGKGEFIIQEYLENINFLNEIYPRSINTFRIITFLSHDGSVKFLGALLRAGIGQKMVDNYHQGGLVIPIDLESGRMIDYGYNYDCELYTEHPDTHFRFKGVEVPRWKELLQFVEKSARTFPMMRFLSWDIAYTDKGFVILEANSGSVYIFINQLSSNGFADLIRDDLKELGYEFPSEKLPFPSFKEIMSRTWKLTGQITGLTR